MNNYKKKVYVCFGFVGMLTSIVLILFWRYLFGEYYFIFPNVVNDGITQFIPRLIKLSKTYSSTGSYKTYTFQNGLGGYVVAKDVFQKFIVSFGEQMVPYLYGVKHALCILFASLFLMMFLLELKWDVSSCLFGGGIFVFSYQMMISSCWTAQSEMAVVITLFLWIFEKLLNRKYWTIVFVPVWGYVAAGVFSILYYQLVYSLFGVVYMNIRLSTKVYKKERVSKNKIIMFNMIFFIILLAMLTIILSVRGSNIFVSDRFNNGLASYADMWHLTFSKKNFFSVLTSYYRTISPNIMGISWLTEYSGMSMQSILDDGGFYITILGYYFIIIGLGNSSLRFRKILLSYLICMAFFVGFPGIRTAFNGFVNETFKLSRLWIILINVFLACYSWENTIRKKESINIRKLFLWASLVTVTLVIPGFWKNSIYLNNKYILESIYFIWIYIFIFYLWNEHDSLRRYLKCIFIFGMILEGIIMNYGYINNSDAITKIEYAKGYYSDNTTAAVEIVDEMENNNTFFRVNKSYESVMLCDSLVQNYNGTSFYYGGADNKYLTAFIKIYGLPTQCNKMGYFTGTYMYPAISAMLSVKYGISYYDYSEYGYAIVSSIEDKCLSKNEYVLPIAFTYYYTMTSDDYYKYDLPTRNNLALKYCIVDQEYVIEDNCPSNNEINQVKPVNTYEINNYILGTPLEINLLNDDEMIVCRTVDEEDKCFKIYWQTIENGWDSKNCRVLSNYEVNGEGFIQIVSQERIKGIILYNYDDKSFDSVEKIIIEIYKASDFYSIFERQITDIKSSIIDTHYANKGVTITVDAIQDGILFIGIPYEAPYNYYIDGELSNCIRINEVFAGVVIPRGRHTISIVNGE